MYTVISGNHRRPRPIAAIKLALIAASVIGLSACASDPSRITATHSFGVKCDKGRLAALEEAQRKTARADFIGVALIGVPLGGKDYAKEIGQLKGACNAR